MSKRVLVTGAGGFIGHHLVKFLVKKGYWVRGADIKYPEYEGSTAHEFELLDLRKNINCLIATRGIEEVYHLAADMGGIGYITAHHADITRNNIMINVLQISASGVLVEPAAVASVGQGSRFMMTIKVNDVDAVCADLKRHGVNLLNGPVDRPWGRRTAAFADPAGNVWEVAKELT